MPPKSVEIPLRCGALVAKPSPLGQSVLPDARIRYAWAFMTSPRSLFAASLAMSITASLNACSSAASVSTPEPVQAQAASALTTVPTAVAPEAAPPTPTPPAVVVPPPELDLLHAVRSDLAASSAYRNQSSQVAALIDGDLETAWNSRTGELVGAAIEVRLPADVHVNAIALTAGFTHMQRGTDLFRHGGGLVSARCECADAAAPASAGHRRRLPHRGHGGACRHARHVARDMYLRATDSGDGAQCDAGDAHPASLDRSSPASRSAHAALTRGSRPCASSARCRDRAAVA